MTDDRQWQAPGGDAPGGGTGTPPPPPVYGSAAPAPSGSPGWAPPPKPGLIPLRPLSLGTLLGASFRVLRRNPRPTFGVALLVQSVAFIVSIAVMGAITVFSVTRIASAAPDDQPAIIAGTVGIGVVSVLLTSFLSLLASAILQGIIVVEVARGSLGEKLPIRGLWGFAKGRIWALVGWAAIVGAVMIVAIGIVVGIIVLMVALWGVLGAVFGVLLGILAGLGFLVLGVWLGTKLSLVPSALVLEQIPLRAAISRSWSLTQDHFWRVFGIQILVGAILSIASNIALIPFSVVVPLLLALLDPNGTGATSSVFWVVAVYILQMVVTVVVATITSIVMTATSALLYVDLRMRKEGLDLDLTRFVESRHSADVGQSNPYLRPAASAAGGYSIA